MRLTSTKVGVVLNVVGVKLFRGIVVGGIVPIGATVTSGLTTLITVPGVDAGIVVLLAGMNNTGRSVVVGNSVVSITSPKPVTGSVKFKFVGPGIWSPVPTRLIGPIQISPVS